MNSRPRLPFGMLTPRNVPPVPGVYAVHRLSQPVYVGEGKSLAELLDEFARVRGESLGELQALKLRPEDLERRGRHPAFGVVTLSQLLATWAVHDLTHLHQISRVMAHQYRNAVGPWSAYLGVLQCAGHSS